MKFPIVGKIKLSIMIFFFLLLFYFSYIILINVVFLSPPIGQVHDKTGSGQEKVWNEELQKEVVPSHKP